MCYVELTVYIITEFIVANFSIACAFLEFIGLELTLIPGYE